MITRKHIKLACYMSLMILTVIGIYAFYVRFTVFHSYVPHAYSIERFMTQYITDTGRYPESKAELLDSGYLVIKNKDGKEKYFWCNSPADSENNFLNRLIWFERFEIQFDIDITKLEKRDGVLYEKGSNKEVYLLSGPHLKMIKHIYQNISIQWYDEVCNWQTNSLKQ